MTAVAQLGEAPVIAALQEARERTRAIVAELDDAVLEAVHSPLMSPLVWDLGHIAAFEDLWIVHRHGRRPLLREGIAEIYDAFETPRARRGDLAFLRPDEARVYLDEVRERTLEVIGERGIGDGAIAELVLRHEHQHTETMLQTMQLAGLRGFRPGATEARSDPGVDLSGLDLVEIPGGARQIGSGPAGFAYDNERPVHVVELAGCRIGRVPVGNDAFREWVRDGGYGRRELWSEAGWRWRTEQDVTRPGAWSEDLEGEWRLGELVALDPDRPVVHVSFHEAQAFARAHGARLPTEAEWEAAATWDPAGGTIRENPWGAGPARPGVHGNLDQLHGGTAPSAGHPDGVSATGVHGLIGDVWEWTQSPFGGYPGFSAFPYREYSEVFFGDAHRVLRGGSWASRPTVATARFRNWDLPERRQIFSGVRLARDLSS